MKPPFEIVFQDEYLIVLNKCAKILVQPSPKKEKHTLTSLLTQEIGEKVYPCHRLDRETTGLIIYARTKEIQKAVFEEFRKGKIKKKYIAFIRGKVKERKGKIQGYIIDREGKKFGERPKKAETFYKVLKELSGFSVIELKPLTGRTNQLRIQLAQIGHPVLGERKYAKGANFAVKFKRVALHAFFISFIHPVSNERVNLEINLPQDMREFLQRK